MEEDGLTGFCSCVIVRGVVVRFPRVFLYIPSRMASGACRSHFDLAYMSTERSQVDGVNDCQSRKYLVDLGYFEVDCELTSLFILKVLSLA